MTSQQKFLTKILTFGGALPFVIGTILTLSKASWIDPLHLVQTYSGIIISFLCGIHWAVYLFYSEMCPRNLLLTSNFVALCAWITLLCCQPAVWITTQILCFSYLLILDKTLVQTMVLPVWFYQVRRDATFIVIGCLGTLQLFLFW